MEELTAYNCIVTLEDGTQYPWLKVHNFGEKYGLVETLGAFEMAIPENVERFINKITEILSRDEAKENLYHDNLEIRIRRDISVITESAVDARIVEIRTSELIVVLSKWKNFLIKYRNKEIKGIDYNWKKS